MLNDEFPDNICCQLDRIVISSLNLGCSYMLLVNIQSVADTRCHELESNTGVHQTHTRTHTTTKQTHWFSEVLFLHTSGGIHDEISIHDMELYFCSDHWVFLVLYKDRRGIT
jgi:hypothetical protein